MDGVQIENYLTVFRKGFIITISFVDLPLAWLWEAKDRMGMQGLQSLLSCPETGLMPTLIAPPSSNTPYRKHLVSVKRTLRTVRHAPGGFFVLLVATVMATVLLAQASRCAAADTAPVPASATLPAEIVLPEDLGYVTETMPGQGAQAVTLVHIQEAHTNLEGQQHLAGILEQLVKTHGLKLVMVEGGEGRASLAALRDFGTPEDRKKVAEKYLRAGILSGEEYLDLVSDYPLDIWGVEEPALYQENVNAYLEVDSLKATLEPMLAPVRQTVDELVARVLDPSVLELDRQAKAFAQEQLTLAEYADALAAQLAQAHLSQDAYPQFQRFAALRRQEGTFDFDRIEQEQAALLHALEQRLDVAALQQLQAHIEGLKQGTRSRASLYTRLAGAAATAGVTPEPHLADYMAYVQEGERLDPAALSNELEQIATAIRAQRSTTPAQQALTQLVDEVGLISRLVGLSLSPDDFQRVRSLDLHGLADRWQGWLATTSPAGAPEAPAMAGLRALEPHLPQLVHFYGLAFRRDEVLSHNTLAKLRESGASLAVLITGGFHSPRITQQMQEAGIRIVTVTPKSTQATDEKLYRAVLKYKSGHGSLEEVLTLSTTASGTPAPRSKAGDAQQQGALRP